MLSAKKLLIASRRVRKIGEFYADQGGYLGAKDFLDGGERWDLYIVPKSQESGNIGSIASNRNGYDQRTSTTNGMLNTLNSNGVYANNRVDPDYRYAYYAYNLAYVGFDDYYFSAVEELRAILRNLGPSDTQVAAFRRGGSEQFTATASPPYTYHVSSTQVSGDDRTYLGVHLDDLSTWTDLTNANRAGFRPIRRVKAGS